MFGFELDGDIIGTIRIVPMGYGLTLTETLVPQLGDASPVFAAGEWEVGRLVLAPEYRSDINALRHCLLLALGYAHEHTSLVRLYATCTHVLSRLYRRFGFEVYAKEVPLAGTGKSYTLIRGGRSNVARALSVAAPREVHS